MIELLKQALHALELEPRIRMPWDKAQAIIRASARFELRVAIAREEADAIVPVPEPVTKDEVLRWVAHEASGLRMPGVVVG